MTTTKISVFPPVGRLTCTQVLVQMRDPPTPVAPDHCLIAAKKSAPKNSFREPPQADRLGLPLPEKLSTFFLSETMFLFPHPVSLRGALRGRHGR
jgi:hypothetical protein